MGTRKNRYVLSRKKKNNVCACKPQFYCIKVGFKRVNIIKVCFLDAIIVFDMNKDMRAFKKTEK